jgi:hypothetical protein
LQRTSKGFQITADERWLDASPLTAAALHEEGRHWASVGKELRIKTSRFMQGAAPS